MFIQATDYLSQLKNNQEQSFLDQSFPNSFIFVGLGVREIQEDLRSHNGRWSNYQKLYWVKPH